MFTTPRTRRPHPLAATRLGLVALLALLSVTAWAGGSREEAPQEPAAAESMQDPGAASDSASDTRSEPTADRAPSGPEVRAVTDDLGTAMEVPVAPRAIFSATLFSDEVLLEIVPAERIAAVSTISRNAIYSNVAERATAIDPVIDFAAEPVIAAGPDLVIAANWSEAAIIEQIRAAGIPVYQIDTPTTLAGILAGVATLGELAGAAEAANALIGTTEARVEALTSAAAAIPAAERRVAIDYNTWGTANGVDTTWQIVLDLAGVDNGAAAFESGDFGQVPMSKEVVVAVDPDVIFVPGYIWGEEGAAEAFGDTVRTDPAFADVAAVRNDRVIAIPERLKGTYSHYLIDAAELVARLVYPERYAGD